MRAHPWQDVSSVSTHYTTLPENSIRRGRGTQHTRIHSTTKLSAQISFADASSASFPSLRKPSEVSNIMSGSVFMKPKLLAGYMICYQLAMAYS